MALPLNNIAEIAGFGFRVLGNMKLLSISSGLRRLY